jgi:anhydro-N-acetylmuramic acid kinase
MQPVIALGLMSGTSLDGIDAALIETDGERVVACGPRRTYPYAAETRARLRAAFGRTRTDDPAVAVAAAEITDLHAAAVAALLDEAPGNWRHPALIGFHGQTVLHAPERGVTVQIGDGARLARLTGIPVASDFRSADVAAGGQGAPLVPVYHRALVESWAERPEGCVAVLNIGGVANLTAIPPDGGMVACDTGPGNAPIDDWVAAHTGECCDRDGALAARGRPDEAWLARALAAPFFAVPPPKSLDRNAFPTLRKGEMSAEDGAATLSAFAVRAVAAAARHLPQVPACWTVCGGGRLNPVLMAGLRAALAVPVLSAEDAGWDGDALEAQAFAFLAVRTERGLPITFPRTTGAPRPLPGGRIDRP